MSPSKLSAPWFFLILTFGISWLFWKPTALSGQGIDTFPVSLLFYLGGAGPPLAGIFLTYLTQGKVGRRDYWQRIIEFKRIGVGWYAVILLTFPILALLAVLVDIFARGKGAQFETVTRVPFAASALLFGPLPEELGWRGYALDRLQVKLSALTSSLILGAALSIWHLPLFFIEGTYQNGLGLGKLPSWLFMMAMLPESILMTWIYNNNQRSTLSAVLFHFMINFTRELFTATERAEFLQVLLLTAAALVVIVVWGPKRLTRGQVRFDAVKKPLGKVNFI